MLAFGLSAGDIHDRYQADVRRTHERLAQRALLVEFGSMATDGCLWYGYSKPRGDVSIQLKVLRVSLMRALTKVQPLLGPYGSR